MSPPHTRPDQRPLPRALGQPTGGRRHHQPEQHPGVVVLVEPHQRRVAQQVLREPEGVGWLVAEHPPDMGMPQPGQHPAPPAFGVDMGRVRILSGVAPGVMEAVIARPVDDGPLRRHAPTHGEERPEPGVRLERAVGKQPVVAHVHAHHRHGVHQHEQRELEGPGPSRGEVMGGEQGSGQRQEQRQQGMQTLARTHRAAINGQTRGRPVHEGGLRAFGEHHGGARARRMGGR